MKLLPLIYLFLPAAAVLGQQPAAPAGAKTASSTAGILLAPDWETKLTPATGAVAVRLADVKALLGNFGEAKADTDAHPSAMVYDGQQMDGAPGENCQVYYLMPLAQAETTLFKKPVRGSVARTLAPGLPDGLFLHTYPVKAGIYNKMMILTDGAQPPRVMSLILKADGINYYPPTPYKKIEREWRTHDYLTQNPGQGMIDTRVFNLLSGGRMIVVNTTGRSQAMLEELEPPGMVVKPARLTPKETITWHVPEPLIRLMLYCAKKQLKE